MRNYLRGNWQARVGQALGGFCPVEAEPGRRFSRCGRAAAHGWDGKFFCATHHPDMDAWRDEQARIQAVVDAAIAKATEDILTLQEAE